MPAHNPIVKEQIIAHRGAAMFAPENTLAAIRLAKEMGANWVEVDVKLTADAQPIIVHDDTLDRTTNGTGWVVTKSFDYVRSLSANRAAFDGYDAEKVPTLRELLETCLECDLGLQLELKPTAGDDVETAELAIATLKEIWPTNNSNLFVSSFSVRSLKTARKLLPDIPRAFAVSVPPRDPEQTLKDLDCQILHSGTFVLSDEQLKTLEQSGVEFAIATINDIESARRVLDGGAQSILSDNPQLLVQSSAMKSA